MRMLPAALLICFSFAQADPPTLIRVHRGAGIVQPYVDGRTAVMVLGIASVSSLPEPWLIEAHDSFESIEQVDRALSNLSPVRDPGAPYESDDILPSARTMTALYRVGLSYRPDEAEKVLPKARYLMVSIYRLRPGADPGFAELVRLRRARYDSINLDRPEIAYQVISGAASGTYLFLAPLASLKTLDDGLAKSPAYAQGVRQAAATDGQKLAADVEIGHEILLFRIDPRMSYVPEDFASLDPDFWKGNNPKNP
ncbi:MAG TPA: hypothetical protein VEU96_14950 [Bryobacteraceae bacterium]|nr:hypothetical protein [Bryobacteraceae bacterium]